MRFMLICKLLSVAFLVATSHATAATLELPDRQTPIPQTTKSVPHIQIGVDPVPEISDGLLQHVSDIPGVEIKPTVLSLPGALGFWIAEDVPLARPDVIIRGREFAHVHPDGSLHASLPPALANQAVKSGWAVHHPWADQRPGWEGFVMIFTPVSQNELKVVLELVNKSYEFVTGRDATSL